MCGMFDIPINYFRKEKPEREVVAEIDGEQCVSEPIFAETAAQTKRKPWKPLAVAVVFTY